MQIPGVTARHVAMHTAHASSYIELNITNWFVKYIQLNYIQLYCVDAAVVGAGAKVAARHGVSCQLNL